jgi:Tol biopolymer transport system component
MSAARPITRIFLPTVLTLSATMATMSPTVATFHGDNGPIAFRRYTNDSHTRGDIFLVRPDGTRDRRLTHSPAGVGSEPDTSPNGRWVVYSVYPDNDQDRSVIKKIRRDGTHRRTLDQTCTRACLTEGYPAWGPRGRRIAFQRGLGPRTGRNKMVALFVMRANGTHARRVTQRGKNALVDQPFEDHSPAWSPNGRRLAFERFSRTREHQAVFTVRLDGTGLRRITPWWLDAAQPDYSPNGRWILFRTRELSDTSGNIQLVRPRGTRRHPVTHTRAGKGKWLSASFSPSGRRITAGFTTVVNGEQNNADLFVFRLDGSKKRNVTRTPNLWESAPDWAPARR